MKFDEFYESEKQGLTSNWGPGQTIASVVMVTADTDEWQNAIKYLMKQYDIDYTEANTILGDAKSDYVASIDNSMK